VLCLDVDGKLRPRTSSHSHQLPLEPSVHDVGSVQQLLRVKQFVSTPAFTKSSPQLTDMDQFARLVKLARKQFNFVLAEKLASTMGSITDAPTTLYASFEQAKLLHAQTKQVEAIQSLWEISRRFKPGAEGSLKEAEVNVLLRLTKWLHGLKDTNNTFIASLVTQHQKEGVDSVEGLIGKVLRDTTSLAPNHSYVRAGLIFDELLSLTLLFTTDMVCTC